MPSGTLIAPPKTKPNSTTNMIGWIVTSSSFSGTRRIWVRLRRMIVNESLTSQRRLPQRRWAGGRRGEGGGRWAGRVASGSLLGGFTGLGGFSCLAGQAQEDVVEGRAAQADVGDPDTLLVQGTGSPGPVWRSRPGPSARARRPAPPTTVASRPSRPRNASSETSGDATRFRQDQVDRLAADLALEAGRVYRRRRSGRGRSRRCRPPAGRPRRGTASSAGSWSRPGPARRGPPTSRAGCAGQGRWSARPGR